MKKFSQAIPALHEAEGAAKSELQKSYAEYFKAKLTKFGAKTPADLTPEQKTEFFNEITKDWTRGEGATKAGQADVDEHGVKESLGINESAMGDVHIMAQEAKNFADFKKQFVKEFKVEGKDNSKELDAWLKQVHDSAMEEMKESNTPEIPKDNDPNQIYVLSGKVGYFKVKDNKWDLIGLRKPEGVTDKDIIILKESEVNEAVSNPSELTSFINKNESHFAAFLKPKKINTSVEGNKAIIKPASGSFTITVDFDKSTIDSTGKPKHPESTSYVEIIEYIKGNTKFKVLNESEEVNEAKEIKAGAEFKEYAMTLLKKAHPDDFDEAKANATVEGILKKCDGDFGACVGMITSSLGESATNEEECPMCKCDPCKCYTNEGNAFGDAVRKAKDAGEKEFEFQGKTYKVEESEEPAVNDLNEAADVTQYFDEVKKALPQLEDLIKKKLGFSPKLTVEQKGNVKLEIKSGDLLNELGKTLVKTLFTKIELGFWGGNVTGDGKSIWFNPKVWYEHPGGGSNGADFVWDSLWWDLASKKWIEGRSLIK